MMSQKYHFPQFCLRQRSIIKTKYCFYLLSCSSF